MPPGHLNLLYIDRASYQLERSSGKTLVDCLLRRVKVGRKKNTKDPSSNNKITVDGQHRMQECFRPLSRGGACKAEPWRSDVK